MMNGNVEKKKSKSGCLWAVIILIVLIAVLSFIGVISVFAIKSSFSSSVSVRSGKVGVDEYPILREIWSSGHGDTKVVTIPLTGMIMLQSDNSGLFQSETSAQRALRSIKRATYDKNVRAIILQINSGGGGITASDIIYKALLDFKKSSPDRKVVSIFGDVSASGAYYIALASDHIIAHPTTITGSIGVLIKTMNILELSNKIGIKDVTIKSGKNKDMLNPMGELNEEQRLMVQKLVDGMHFRFVKLVAEGRNLTIPVVKELADGRIYSADEALELKLIDQIGYWDDTVLKTEQLLDVKNIKIYRYEQDFTFSSLFKAMQGWNPVQSMVKEATQPKLLYQWSL